MIFHERERVTAEALTPFLAQHDRNLPAVPTRSDFRKGPRVRARPRGTEADFLTNDEVRWMYERAEDVTYPEGSAVFSEDP
ncbi:MAG: hypothetical protein H8E30_10020 [Alphaproteobacteria bacterium]|nr:hypothetical protein [Alphaproteobacteria bacterium]